MKLKRSSNGQLVTILANTKLGVGGEARIFGVAGAPKLAAKVYHRPMPEHAAKLAAMIANPPEDPSASQGQVSIAWPADLLITTDGSERVVGFLMPRVRDMNPIIDFYHPKTRRLRHPHFNYRYLVRTARNLAACVSALHARGYVIGDLNESNILVGKTALVSLVDTDSFQVPDPRNGKIYRCRVGKPEFTPAELQAVKFAWVDRKQEHDLFGLSVLFFQLLMEGIHPFAGRYTGRGDPPTLEERIGVGAFPYAAGGCPGTLPMPTAPDFQILNERVRELFLQCFTNGNFEPSQRPDARAWQRALLAAENSLTTCAVNDQHHFGNHLPDCPWCKRQRFLGGVDSFPSREAVKLGWHLRGGFHFRKPALALQKARRTALAPVAQLAPVAEWPNWVWTIPLYLNLLFFIAYFWSLNHTEKPRTDMPLSIPFAAAQAQPLPGNTRVTNTLQHPDADKVLR